MRILILVLAASAIACSGDPAGASGDATTDAESGVTSDVTADVTSDVTTSDVTAEDELPFDSAPPPDSAPVDCVDADYHVTLEVDGGERLTFGREGVPSWDYYPCCSEDPPLLIGAAAVDEGHTKSILIVKPGKGLRDTPDAHERLSGTMTVTRDDAVLGGVVEGTFMGMGTTTPYDGTMPAPRAISFRVCRRTVLDLGK
jgi:hypothetical protein